MSGEGVDTDELRWAANAAEAANLAFGDHIDVQVIRSAADELDRLRGERDTLRARLDGMPFQDAEDYQDWLNDLMENAGDEWDDDVSMEAIATRYVRHLEARAALAGDPS